MATVQELRPILIVQMLKNQNADGQYQQKIKEKQCVLRYRESNHYNQLNKLVKN